MPSIRAHRRVQGFAAARSLALRSRTIAPHARDWQGQFIIHLAWERPSKSSKNPQLR